MFSNLIGNEKIKKDLEAVIQNSKISHSYLFIGNKGIGKSLFAKEFAKAILCNSDNELKPCCKCKSCLEFDNNNHPDFYYISLEDENSIKIETIRKIQAKVQELPIVSKKKIYVIDDSEYMTKEAQNCLLKTIEEPPEFVIVILITSNENKILNTIKSRCIKIYFQNIEDNILKEYLEKKQGIENISRNNLRAYNGSVGKALQIYSKQEKYNILEEVFTNIEQYNLVEAINKLEVLYKGKDNIQEMLDYINVILLNKAKEDIKYLEYIDEIEKVKKKIAFNSNYDMSIDSLLFKIWKD